MEEVVIKVENLSKLYQLGQIGSRTLSRDLNRWWAKVNRKPDPYARIGSVNDRTKKDGNDFVWSLRDINFEVKKGEVLGIIGRNGAGKSTLLKIVSKLTKPTTGNIKLQGRIASLLEVGTGFHPELTGKENIFMNGAILGMKKWEIQKHFDAIVDFAGVEKYIDTPVKRYSSGMYVRLAFAVAAFLEPDILIVDEVLAVGDAEFQKKCLGRMKDVSNNEGRTILFVSHNMAAVKSLCTKGLVLKHGNLVYQGSQLDAVNYYQSTHEANSSFSHDGSMETAPGNENIRVLEFDVLPLRGDILTISSGIEFVLTFYNAKPNINLDVTFELVNLDEVVLFHHGTVITSNKDSHTGIYTVKGKLPADYLNTGSYRFNLIFGENQRYPLFGIQDIILFEIMNESFGSTNKILPGVTRPYIEYDVRLKHAADGKS